MIRPMLSATALLLLAAGAQADEGADLDARAEALFAAVFHTSCDWAFREDGSVREPPERHDFAHTPPYGETYTVTIYRFACNLGAYNTQEVYLVNRGWEGLTPVAFAAPRFDAMFENDDDENGALISIEITGFSAWPILVNSTINPKTGDIEAVSYWRGIGDASSFGVWRRDGEDYVLDYYAVDPSYDGEINPVELVNYERP